MLAVVESDFNWSRTRELHYAITVAAHKRGSGEVMASDLSLGTPRAAETGLLALLERGGFTYDQLHTELDRLALPLVMQRAEGGIRKAAESLEITRPRLRKKLAAMDGDPFLED